MFPPETFTLSPALPTRTLTFPLPVVKYRSKYNFTRNGSGNCLSVLSSNRRWLKKHYFTHTVWAITWKVATYWNSLHLDLNVTDIPVSLWQQMWWQTSIYGSKYLIPDWELYSLPCPTWEPLPTDPVLMFPEAP